jgi:large subunit ribosomal protein L33
MAKSKKGPRQNFGLKCADCSNFNYITERNKLNTTEKLTLHKYCKTCRKATSHKEVQKLK